MRVDRRRRPRRALRQALPRFSELPGARPVLQTGSHHRTALPDRQRSAETWISDSTHAGFTGSPQRPCCDPGPLRRIARSACRQRSHLNHPRVRQFLAPEHDGYKDFQNFVIRSLWRGVPGRAANPGRGDRHHRPVLAHRADRHRNRALLTLLYRSGLRVSGTLSLWPCRRRPDPAQHPPAGHQERQAADPRIPPLR